jgi:hypothetical protein
MRQLFITPRLWGRTAKGLTVAGGIVALLALTNPGFLQAQTPTILALVQQIYNALLTHDANQTQQDEGHDSTQTSQHQTLSDNLATHQAAQTTALTAHDGKLDGHVSAQTAHDTAQATHHSQVSQKLDDLQAAMEGHSGTGGSPGKPWVKVGTNDTKTNLDALIAQYPFSKYQWGNQVQHFRGLHSRHYLLRVEQRTPHHE